MLSLGTFKSLGRFRYHFFQQRVPNLALQNPPLPDPSRSITSHTSPVMLWSNIYPCNVHLRFRMSTFSGTRYPYRTSHVMQILRPDTPRKRILYHLAESVSHCIRTEHPAQIIGLLFRLGVERAENGHGMFHPSPLLKPPASNVWIKNLGMRPFNRSYA